MTKQEIINHYDFSGKLTLPNGFELLTMYPGGDKLHYFLFGPDNNIIFSGSDYSPSPLYPSIDSVESVVGCLSFLTLQDGATDKEYFADYTPEQIAFRDSSVAEEINLLISDFELYYEIDRHDEDMQECIRAAKEYFTSNYTQLI